MNTTFPRQAIVVDRHLINRVEKLARDLFFSVTESRDQFGLALEKVLNRRAVGFEFVLKYPDDCRSGIGHTNTLLFELEHNVYALLVYSDLDFDEGSNFEPALLCDPESSVIYSHLKQALLLRYRVEQSQHDVSALGILDDGFRGLSELDVAEGLKDYNVTPTESQLAEQLFLGASPKAIADMRGVSVQTVRKQLQSLLRKTDCVSQEALVVLVYERCLHYQTRFNSNHAPLPSPSGPLCVAHANELLDARSSRFEPSSVKP